MVAFIYIVTTLSPASVMRGVHNSTQKGHKRRLNGGGAVVWTDGKMRSNLVANSVAQVSSLTIGKSQY